jgi:cell wall-associated NlpC family hydrolase
MKTSTKFITTAILLFAPMILSSPVSAKSPKPTLAQIKNAKQLEVQKKIAAKEAATKLKSAHESLKTLTSRALDASRAYDHAQAALALAAEKSNLTTNHLVQTQTSVSNAHAVIGKLASNAYKMGGGFSDVESLLSANGPQDLIDRILILNKLGDGNKSSLDRYMSAEVAVRAAKSEVERAQLIQQQATASVAAEKRIADNAKSAQQTEVDKLQHVQDFLLTQLASAKKFRITLEQQRELALLEEAKANQAAKTPNQAKIWQKNGSKGRSTFQSTPGQRAIAVAFAKKQVLAGKPYVWGAQGPNAFDCSGLVYAAYKATGMGWPTWGRLNASLYYQTTLHVPLSQIQPGDLIFYSFDGTVGSIHHMSIYEGNGMDWEARSTRTGLRHSNIYSVDGLMPFAGRV